MTKDEKIMQLHEESGKFGRKEDAQENLDSLIHLFNILSLHKNIFEIANLLERILKAHPCVEMLETMIIPQMNEKGFGKVVEAYTKLCWQKETLARLKRHENSIINQ